MNFQKIKAIFGDIVAQDGELTRKIEEAQAKIADLKSAPLARVDYVANGLATIDGLAAGYLQNLQSQIDSDLKRDPLDFATPESFFRGFCPNFQDVRTIHPAAAAALFGDLIKKNFADAVSKLDWPKTCGPTLAERLKMIATLERDLVSLQKERADLRQAATESGLQIGLFSENPDSMSKAQLAARARTAEREAAGKLDIHSGV